MRRFFPLALILTMAALGGARQADPQKDLDTALAKFDKALPAYPVEVRKDADFLRGLLKDYYLHREELTASEAEVAEALRDDLGLTGFSGRGGAFGDLYKSSKPAAPPPKAPPAKTPPKTPVHSTTKAPPKVVARSSGSGGFHDLYGSAKPVVLSPKAKVHAAKISGLRSKPTFVAGSNDLPGGAAVGYVTLAIDGKTRRIVEVPGTRALAPGKRAATIASRLRAAAAADAFWWMKLRVGTENGESVLVVPGSGVPHILTADKAFAKEWGTTPDALAKRLRAKIRRAYDEVSADPFAGRDAGDEHDMAIEARQAGDEVAATDPAGAEKSYLAAIGHDGAYLVPYLRLAALYYAQNKPEDAKAILEKAQGAEGMSDEDKQAARAAIKP